MINQSLIDSNMFLRSVFLSIDFFETNSTALSRNFSFIQIYSNLTHLFLFEDFNITKNRILSYFDVFERRILFLCRMMNIINIHNLSQENISCLNTTLIVLMLANRRKRLPKYLKAIKTKSIEMMLANDLIHVNDANRVLTSLASSNANTASSSTISNSTTPSPPSDLMTNFKDLLLFWQSHYLQKDKDCAGLEQNSKIDFSYWRNTVETLLDPNCKNECSLNFYIDKNDFNYMNKNRLDEYRSD